MTVHTPNILKISEITFRQAALLTLEPHDVAQVLTKVACLWVTLPIM